MSLLKGCLVIMVCFSLVFASVLPPAPTNRSEVTSLPGWEGALPNKWWSGYIHSGTPPGFPQGAMYQHYILMECEFDPVNAPVVVWYNGGPGASSMFGQLIELGTLLLNQDSLDNDKYRQTGIPQLIRNDFAWTKVANVLIVDNPPPVGFSYCDPAGVTGKGESCGPWTDGDVATTNYQFLKQWVTVFPEFQKNDLYIVGESYAGVYVPIIVQQLLNHPNNGVNLKGFAVGDGCMGTEVLCGGGGDNGPYFNLIFFCGHGQVSNLLCDEILFDEKICTKKELMNGKMTAQCSAKVDELNAGIGGYYSYNLYDDCVYEEGIGFVPQTSHKVKSNANVKTSAFHRLMTTKYNRYNSYNNKHEIAMAAEDGYPCPGNAMNIWLKRSDVRKALHVAVDSFYFSGDNGVGFNYTETEPNVLPIYERALKTTNLRVLVYNGDTDPAINSFVTQSKYFPYFDKVGISMTQKWRPWTLDGMQRMGGYVQSYGNNFDFLTIRGSGHMVPEYKPERALSMLAHFLEGSVYPKYVAPPSSSLSSKEGKTKKKSHKYGYVRYNDRVSK